MSDHFEQIRDYPPSIGSIPLFAVWAAEDLYKHWEAIRAEAMQAGQVAQDPEAERDAFVSLVGGLIRHHWEDKP